MGATHLRALSRIVLAWSCLTLEIMDFPDGDEPDGGARIIRRLHTACSILTPATCHTMPIVAAVEPSSVLLVGLSGSGNVGTDIQDHARVSHLPASFVCTFNLLFTPWFKMHTLAILVHSGGYQAYPNHHLVGRAIRHFTRGAATL
jgi:hypothetical protein